jgi:hypothetical protein
MYSILSACYNNYNFIQCIIATCMHSPKSNQSTSIYYPNGKTLRFHSTRDSVIVILKLILDELWSRNMKCHFEILLCLCLRVLMCIMIGVQQNAAGNISLYGMVPACA